MDEVEFYKALNKMKLDYESYPNGSIEKKMCDVHISKKTIWDAYMHLFIRALNDIEHENKLLKNSLFGFLEKYKTLSKHSSDRIFSANLFEPETDGL